MEVEKGGGERVVEEGIRTLVAAELEAQATGEVAGRVVERIGKDSMMPTGITELIATLTVFIAAAGGLVRLAHFLWMAWYKVTGGTNTVDVLEMLYVTSADPDIRNCIIQVGGREVLEELCKNKGDLKAMADRIDRFNHQRRAVLKLAYEAKVIAEERRKYLIRRKDGK